ncbi:MAG TPA: TlpA disulfide reductase family protein [Burkholderiales bacterium]|nr:TlpA disulfide reductase family protein [Burkholderiales bacterium]
MKARALAVLIVVAGVSAAAGVGYHLWSRDGGNGPGMDTQEVVERVLKARLVDVKGATGSLEQWRGSVLVVNYWATWCAPCREEIPVFVRLQERYGSRGLQFVGIAIDQPDKVAEFAREFRINYPLLLGGVDAIELLRQVGNRAGVLPYTLVIDRKGVLVSRESGGLKEVRLEHLIQPLL